MRRFEGVPHVLERALRADFALIRAHQADRYGNLIYSGPGTFNQTMAGAAEVTIAEVDEIVSLGGLRPERIQTPGVYVQRVVRATGGGRHLVGAAMLGPARRGGMQHA